MIDFKKLAEPFPPTLVEWRVGSMNKDKTKGMALAYIDARSVQDRLDLVCGVENWQNRFSHADTKTICEIGIRVNNEWIWKADGAGDTDFEAEKGALSDAFKRAAVKWGVGRYLYDLPSVWVQLDDYKRILPSELQRLDSIIGKSGAKVTELSGLSKEPAKFWSKEKLTLSLPDKHISATQDVQFEWFYNELEEKVVKAPNVELLNKLYLDNKHIINRFDELRKEKIIESFSIRKEQHEEMKAQ